MDAVRWKRARWWQDIQRRPVPAYNGRYRWNHTFLSPHQNVELQHMYVGQVLPGQGTGSRRNRNPELGLDWSIQECTSIPEPSMWLDSSMYSAVEVYRNRVHPGKHHKYGFHSNDIAPSLNNPGYCPRRLHLLVLDKSPDHIGCNLPLHS